MENSSSWSPLERVFKFADETFRRYMGMSALTGSTEQLVSMADDMASRNHPTGQAAAGWAYAEAAMRADDAGAESDDTQTVAYDDRISMLEDAKRSWLSATAGFDDEFKAAATVKGAGGWLGIRLRTQYALAQLPAMQL